jgi:hypothetical protein
MLLLLNAAYFMNLSKVMSFTDKPRRYTVGEVELGINYVLIISTGLWGYNIEIRCSLLH